MYSSERAKINFRLCITVPVFLFFSVLTLDFNDGTTATYTIQDLHIHTPTIGTRSFWFVAENEVFTGPGKAWLVQSKVQLHQQCAV